MTLMASIPNIISLVRLACMPALLLLAYQGKPYWFLLVLIVAFLTDALDGYIARRFNQTTALGARLDSWSDFAIYLSLAVSVFWLWPDIVSTQYPYIMLVVVSIITPTLIGLIKFSALTSYHTWAVKIAAACTAISSILLFTGYAAWPFQISSILCIVAAIEQIAITLYLPQLHSNVKTLWHVIRRQKHSARKP